MIMGTAVAAGQPTLLSALDSKEAYVTLVEQRVRRCHRDLRPLMSKCGIVMNYAISHASAVHSMTLSHCGTHLYTGGQDGFIRRYGLSASLNGYPEEQGVNLTMRQPTNERLPVLLGYWENEELGPWNDDNDAFRAALAQAPSAEGAPPAAAASLPASKWGPKIQPYSSSSSLSPVYSLAVQQQELWGLSGTQKGCINLYTIRHDEGHIRHVFKPVAPTAPSSSGHKPSAISVLKLEQDEEHFLSGGWDGRIIQWDLNTGGVSRTFHAHKSQISAIAPRPAVKESTSAGKEKKETPDEEEDVDADGEMDEDADGDVDPDHVGTNLTTYESSTKLSEDVLMTSSIEGTVLLWDRRVAGFVRKLPPVDSASAAGARTKATTHWCPSVSWHDSGLVATVSTRHSALVYDLRTAGYTHRLAPPSGSGIVSHVSWVSQSQCLVASEDCIRIFDVGPLANEQPTATGSNVITLKGTVVPGSGGSISSIVMDARRKVLVAASGSRGWEGTSSEGVVVFDVL